MFDRTGQLKDSMKNRGNGFGSKSKLWQSQEIRAMGAKPSASVNTRRTPASAESAPRSPARKPQVAKLLAAPFANEKLHKVLADAGIGSRRDMEERIAEGRISVNGEPAHVGQRVTPSDVIRFDGRIVRRSALENNDVPKVLIYHKPAGEIVSKDDPEGRPTVFDHLPRIGGARWIAVGRLDFNTEGLLLFTDSGNLANFLMHPRHEIEREYAVRVQGTMSPEAKDKLLKGIKLDDGIAKFTTLEEGGGKGFNRWYNVTLSEGRNREVRRMFEAVGLPVSRLIRVKYGNLELPSDLPRGKTRRMSTEETEKWLDSISYKKGMSTAPAPRAPERTPRPAASRAPASAPKAGRKFGQRDTSSAIRSSRPMRSRGTRGPK